MTPAISLAKLLPLLRGQWQLTTSDPLPKVIAWSCSGYYRNSLGVKGRNDRGINDDAIGIISPNCDFRVQANVDPSLWKHGVASLKPNQVIWYKPGFHGFASVFGHNAFRQDSPVIVKRDSTEIYRKGFSHNDYGICLGNGYWTDANWEGGSFWTNLHKQSGRGTSSLGCQTIPANVWNTFYKLLISELKRENQTRFPCILLQGPIN